MNLVDATLLVLSALTLWAGWRIGFLRGSLGLLTWAGSMLLGLLLYPDVAALFEKKFNPGVWLLPVAFISTVVIARLVLGFASRYILRRIPERVGNSRFNRVLGLIPGAVNAFIFATIISALLLAWPARNKITDESRNSEIAMRLANGAEWANKKLAPVFDGAVRQTMSSLANEPVNSHEPIELHFTFDRPVARPLLEARMLEMINGERAKEGLKLLEADYEMVNVARTHSKDMFARGYFAHENPDGQDPFDRMKAAKVKFKTAGENLALAQTLELAHSNLMNSPGHRANIMNPDFGRVGIGILDGGFYGLMISQEFRD